MAKPRSSSEENEQRWTPLKLTVVVSFPACLSPYKDGAAESTTSPGVGFKIGHLSISLFSLCRAVFNGLLMQGHVLAGWNIRR